MFEVFIFIPNVCLKHQKDWFKITTLNIAQSTVSLQLEEAQ